MTWHNQTTFNEFILLGFSNLGQFQVLLFIVFLIVYLLTVMGNFLIIFLVIIDPTLHSPMYFFLQNLSFAEVGFVSNIVPMMLVNLLSEKKTISFLGCRAQIYFVFFFGTMECYILTVMAYDRFVAICNPLRYTVVMNRNVCVLLVIVGWTLGVCVGIIHSAWVLGFPFCRSNTLFHFFCDVPPILPLACADTYRFKLFSLIITFLAVLCPFLLILISYIHIVHTILRMTSVEGRRKAFSTCSSHIIVVTLFYSSVSLTHIRVKTFSSTGNKHLLSLSYIVFTPMLNPIIYSLRNKEVRGALSRLIRKKIS
ncbi:olfactory receptor 10A7-like [Tiliqua scincoides]|uniref:olfactory receptor 10A7-like n=1 Tax=Tiliqua scincoides TaxID=71010 RepID=UPI0034631472